jgi:site-specific recombinase XerD
VTEPAVHLSDAEVSAGGWQRLWDRDQWHERELPHAAERSGSGASLHFEGLQQPWLKEAAKRWARARLFAATAPQSIQDYLIALRAFSRWLAAHAPHATTPAMVSRELLIDYLLFVRTGDLAPATQQLRIGTLRAFLTEQREDGLTGLPPTAVIHGPEIPNREYRLPKQLEPGVFDQFLDPANLALLANEQHRTIVLLLATTGLRVSSVASLARDALEIGSDQHPYLRYRNHKLRREAVLPIGSTLTEQIRRQHDFLNDLYGPDGTDYLLPSPPAPAGRGGSQPISHRTIGIVIKSYVRKADIRDHDGQLASWVHPHLFRHHLATTLINDGVSLPVIQKVLDHATIAMTVRYAHLHDDTLREAITRWHQRINIRGERIALPVNGPLQDAAWMKERIAHARQALPNGYCGLPLVQTCPHPNACLSCDNFLTDNRFRTIHDQQLQRTRTMLADARARDALRLIEILERDQQSLTRILDGLDALDEHSEPSLDLIADAAAGRVAPGT